MAFSLIPLLVHAGMESARKAPLLWPIPFHVEADNLCLIYSIRLHKKRAGGLAELGAARRRRSRQSVEGIC